MLGHRSIRRQSLIIIALLLSLSMPSPSVAQSGFPLPPVQVIELSGVEPPPPGIVSAIDFAMGGGGQECDPDQAHLIAGTGFSPSIAPGFGVYIECIEDVSVPLILYVYAVRGDSTIGTFVASRTITPASTRNALVQVRVRRSFPYRVDDLRLILNKAGGNFGTRTVGAMSACLGSYPAIFNVGEQITVARLGGVEMYVDPRQLDAALLTLPFQTTLEITEGPQCGADGLSYWQVTAAGQTGWVPQGNLTLDWIGYVSDLYSCEGTLPSVFRSGQRARIPAGDGTPAIFRAEPNPALPAFRLLPPLTGFTMVFGPHCGIDVANEPVAYWLVQLDDGTKGWVIEVTATVRLVEPQ